ncbi:MAG: hypothetical protein KJZ53_05415 [Anaerolineales bacterium]|nr:hypothetical protein [Anaerolineales bacterium]
MSEFTQVEKRVKSLWYQDGIGELAAGLILILLGAYFAAGQYFGPESPINAILEPSLVLVLLALVALGRRLVEALKTRLVYPRTGFVEYHSEEPAAHHRLFAGAAAGILAAAFAMLGARLATLQAIPALTGLAGGVVLILWQLKLNGAGRFVLLASISLALGLVLGVSSLPEGYAIALYYALMGLALLASGVLVLNSYVRNNPLRN